MNNDNVRANQVFADAIKIEPPQKRTAFLDRECGDDQLLRKEVEALLDAYARAGSFLEQPATGLRLNPENEHAGEELANPAGGETAHYVKAGESVLNSLGERLETVPHVLLRDANGDVEPIAFPGSKEVPQTGAKYHLLGEIARGGIGAILKGRDTDIGRDLAVKVLLDEHRDRPEVIQRFIEEAQIGGQLQHPGIAPVYELGQFDDERPFFSMKLIKGDTLSTLLAARDQPSDDRGKLLTIFEQICQTMAYAHSRGVIHRDLKPSNIMVGAFGEVQVMDWGLAKVLSKGGVVDEKKAYQKHKDVSVIQTLRSVGSDTPGDFGSDTRMGSVLGTPAYMPPEQALGEIDHLDERSDVFGLGAILCEILTGQPPYVGSDAGQILRLAARGKLEDCFARLDDSGADADLIELSKRCLAPEPSDRPRDAGELAHGVSGYLESVEAKLRETELERAAEAARVVEERKRRRVSLALGASFLLLVTVAGGGWIFFKNQEANRLRVATIEVNETLSEARLHLGLAASAEPTRRLQELEKASIVAEQAGALAGKHQVDDKLQTSIEQMQAEVRERVAVSRQQIEQSTAEHELLTALESIRLGQTEKTLGSRSSLAKRYETAFRDAGLDLEKLSVEEAARRIRRSPLQETIIAALDDWSSYRHAVGSVQTGNHGLFFRAVEESRWTEAAQLGEILIRHDPDDALTWLRVAPVMALSGDEAGYRDFCRRMAEHFAEKPDADFSREKTCKACLLRPDSIDIEELPTNFLDEYLKTKKPIAPGAEATFDPLLGWFWGTQALVAYRSGDATGALACLAQSRTNRPMPAAEAFNLAIETLAKHQLNQRETRQVIETATQLVEELLDSTFEAGSHHDLLIALVLLREAEAQVLDKVRPAFDSSDVAEAAALRAKAQAVADAADPNQWRRNVRAALEEGDVDQLRQLVTSEDLKLDSPELITWLGVALREAGEKELAITVMQQGLGKHADDFWLNWELANTVDVPYGSNLIGIGYLRSAVACRPSSGEPLRRLVSRLRNAGFYEEAKYHCLRLIESWPNNYWYRTNYASVLLLLGDSEAALGQAMKASEIDPFHDWGYRYTGDALMRQGKIEAAIEAYQKAVAVNRDLTTQIAFLQPLDATNAKQNCAFHYRLLANAFTLVNRTEEASAARKARVALLR
ncbi:MAG: protein kinase domain-containing protein, partial [Bythopirellula sp.]